MRTPGSNGDRLDKHDKEIFTLKQDAEASNARLTTHIENHIKEDLTVPKFTGSEKFLYTYEEIADRWDVPKSRVQKVAEENDLTRRKFSIG